MSAVRVTRWSQRFLGTAAVLFVAWQAAALVGVERRVGVLLGVHGFVLLTVFGKAYSLVPAYFDRQLAVPSAPMVHYPLATAGVLAMVAGVVQGDERLHAAGGLLWLVGALAFVGVLGWTLRGNLTGRETGTGGANADRAEVDRVANPFMLVAVAYLAAGAYETAAVHAPLPSALGAYPAGSSHLLAAGAAALMLFAVGFRLLPRFLVASPPRGAVYVVLPAGALGPGLVAVGLPGGPLLQAGAVLESVAVVGFAVTYWRLLVRTDRDRVGFWGPLVGVTAGATAALLALHVAFAGYSSAFVAAHVRLMIVGLLGLSIVGAAYQFYPPTVGEVPGSNDRTALASIALIGCGLLLEVVGLLGGWRVAVAAGQVLGLVGAGAYAYLLIGIFVGPRRR